MWHNAELSAEINSIKRILEGRLEILTVAEKENIIKLLQSGYSQEKIKI